MDASTGTLIMIICYLFGSGLIIMEAFMPGFGVAGIAGLVLEIAAIVLTNTYFGLGWSLGGTFLVLLFVGIAVFISYRSAMKGRGLDRQGRHRGHSPAAGRFRRNRRKAPERVHRRRVPGQGNLCPGGRRRRRSSSDPQPVKRISVK